MPLFSLLDASFAKAFSESFSRFPDEEQKLIKGNPNHSNFLALCFKRQVVRGMPARDEKCLGHCLFVRTGLLQQAPGFDFSWPRLID